MGLSCDDVSMFTELGIALDGMGFSFGLCFAEWAKVEDQEQQLYSMLEHNRFMRLPVQLFELVSRWRGETSGGPSALATPSAPYQKIASLLDFVEKHASDAASVLAAIESFGAGVGQWLKVAADSKARLLEAAGSRRPRGPMAPGAEAYAEFGTFVGYTAVRLACWLRAEKVPQRSASLEVDPVHALLTRHHLSLAGLSARSDVWIGQALDLAPRLAEDFGGVSVGFVFMDHRGTRFHSDLALLERQRVLPPRATYVCDNTLKPGSPLCLWLASRSLGGIQGTCWSMNEFAHWNSEDWMLVADIDHPGEGASAPCGDLIRQL